MTSNRGMKVKQQHYRVSIAHPIYRSLMQEDGLGSRLHWSKRKTAKLTNDEGSDSESDKGLLGEDGKEKQVEQDVDDSEFEDCIKAEKEAV